MSQKPTFLPEPLNTTLRIILIATYKGYRGLLLGASLGEAGLQTTPTERESFK